MKRYLFLTILVFLLNTQYYGQAVINIASNNYLFANIETYLEVAIPEVSADNIYLSSKDCEIEKIEKNRFTVKPKIGIKTANIRVLAGENGDTIPYGTYTYRILPIPTPDIYLNYTQLSENFNAKIQKEDFPKVANLQLKYNSIFFQHIKTNRITSFTISYKKKRKIISKTINGNQIPYPICQEIKELNDNNSILLNNIFIGNNKTDLEISFIVN